MRVEQPTVDGVDPVTIVIPAYNASTTLARQLVALEAQTHGRRFTVVVVDNASTDQTAAVAHSYRSRTYDLSVVTEAARGVNCARNAGVAAADDGVVLLCDADDIVAEVWVESLVSSLEPGTWVAGPVDYLRFNSARTRDMWNVDDAASPRVTAPWVDSTFGGNCGFYKSMWSDVGGFDSRLSGKGDENEMFARAYRAGYRPVQVPDAVVHYRLRPSARDFVRVRFRQGRQQVAIARMTQDSEKGVPSAGSVGLDLARVVAAAPKYLRGPRARFRWLGSASRQAGRFAEVVRPTVLEPPSPSPSRLLP